MQNIFINVYPDEEFREIEWNGVKLYAGSMGTIKDKDGIYKPQNKTFKYNRVSVGGKIELVHRIIATAFVPNPDCLETVNHINGDKRDNRAENLEWCTRESNIQKYYGLIHSPLVAQYDLQGNKLFVYASQTEAARKTGITREFINMCCMNKKKTAGGYVWKYEE